MSNYILEMNNMTKKFFNNKALDNVNLKIEKGEIHTICGENGAGKSTLMNVLSGVFSFEEYEGEIIYKNEKCQFRDLRDSEAKGIVIIHQELALSPFMSIAENVFLGNEITSKKGIVDWNQTKLKAIEMLKRVGLENENIEAPINTLSVGKQQLVEIAKALAKNVDLLILDEPTASLNDEDSKTLLDIMLNLKSHGVTCILISHKLNEVNYVADKITIIRDGKTIETLDKHEISEDRIIRGMVGRELTNRYPERKSNIGNVVLEVKNWNVFHPEYQDKKVIKNVSFNIKKGEILGFAGLMGAGRTELAMSIFGRTYGQNISGTVLKDGKEINVSDVRTAIDNGLVYVSEDRKGNGLVMINGIRWNMSLSSLNKDKFSSKGILNKSAEIVSAEEYVKLLNIRCLGVEQNVNSLSGGNQQKVVISKAMLTESDIIILDEPTRGIDVGAKYEIYKVMNDLVKEGKSIMVISSEMPELLGVCDRIYIINEGEIAGELINDNISQEDIMQIIMQHTGGKD